MAESGRADRERKRARARQAGSNSNLGPGALAKGGGKEWIDGCRDKKDAAESEIRDEWYSGPALRQRGAAERETGVGQCESVVTVGISEAPCLCELTALSFATTPPGETVALTSGSR